MTKFLSPALLAVLLILLLFFQSICKSEKKLKIRKSVSLVLAGLLVFSLFCGCAAKSADSEESYVTYESADTSYAEKAEEFIGAEAPAASSESTQKPVYPDGVKLIFSADLDLETTEFDLASQKLTDLVNDMGGYFQRSEVSSYGTYRSGYFTVRIPAENFKLFCEKTGGIAKLNSIERSADDVSEVYYDTAARLETQRTKLGRLQELLEKAENMEDIITIESAISETELAIESLTGQIRGYDSLINFSTVTIYLQEVYQLSDSEEPVIGFWARLGSAFKMGLKNFLRGIEDVLFAFAYSWLGILVFLAVVAVIVILVVRRRRKKNAKKAQNTNDEQK